MESPGQHTEEDAVPVEAIIADITATEAPRRFWLCQTDDLDADMVVGWGLAFEEEDYAVLLGRNTRLRLYTSESAERIHARLSRLHRTTGLRLVWVDPAVGAA